MKETIILDSEEYKPIPIVNTDIPKEDMDPSETDIVHPLEISETIKEVNKDVLEMDGKMSSIDRMARLTRTEKSGYHELASLINLDFCPKSLNFIIRAGLRFSVSLEGKGRKEAVDIVRGVKDAESKSGFIDKFAGVFAGKPK